MHISPVGFSDRDFFYHFYAHLQEKGPEMVDFGTQM
jgi:hypothetical protein